MIDWLIDWSDDWFFGKSLTHFSAKTFTKSYVFLQVSTGSNHRDMPWQPVEPEREMQPRELKAQGKEKVSQKLEKKHFELSSVFWWNVRRDKKRKCRHSTKSGRDYLDAERTSCLMSTHWNTVSSNRQPKVLSLFSSILWFDWVSSMFCNSTDCASSIPTSNSTFPGLGFESQSRQSINQSINHSINQSTTQSINQSINR